MAGQTEQLDLVYWTLSTGEVELFVDLRTTLRKVAGVVDAFGDSSPAIDKQLHLLDRFLGNRGACCEVPPR